MLGKGQSGFTIMETVVTAGIVAVVLSATIGVLTRYTDTDIRSQKTLRAQHIAQGEVDEVLARHAIENSLVSDTQGRSRYYPIEQAICTTHGDMEGLGYLVSQYYYHNFPLNFPNNTIPFDHSAVGTINPDNVQTLFQANQGRTATGAPTDSAQSAYSIRYQLLGIEERINSSDLNLLINMTSDSPQPPLTAAQRSGLYNDHFWVPGTMNTSDTKGNNVYNPLIGDSSPSVALSATRWSNNMRRYTTAYDGYRNFVSKVLIVRVYDRENPRREVGHAYGVLTGRVQL